MATTTRLAHQTFRLNAAVSFTSCQPGARGLTRLPLPTKVFKSRNLAVKTNQNLKWAVRLNLVNQSSPPKSTVDVERLVGFLYDDLPHLFDDQGIDRAAYDEQVKFRDPITKHDTIGGYLFNISLLKKLFRPDFQLHWVKQTGPYEITTRWTMVMKFVLLPWKPELIFTGTSVMGINPDTGKFCSHVDFWDSIVNNDYFSLEGFGMYLSSYEFTRPLTWKRQNIRYSKELQTMRLSALSWIDYCSFTTYMLILCCRNQHLCKLSPVREYTPFVVVETNGDKLSGSSGFNDVTGKNGLLYFCRYIFGKNSTMEKIPMTTPVFTEAYDADMSKVSIQIVLPLNKDMNSLPGPNQETVSLRKVEGGIAAVLKFSGKPTEDIVYDKEKALRSSLIRDGLRPKKGCLLARYNDPGRTWSFTMV
ncbi:hypothetical protein Patl1_13155 [Pistacia atlantica]|uniref:Uncharacterized protein n=1 Tax=Pistacia atlantica TaxID=434234 RepID=A0ACC1AT80_9ROSI|nr:hypothetical protein Patl1_13155 [Pistacia atlantica]